MQEVQQSTQGSFYVRTDSATYSDSPANTATDFGVTVPALPDGAIERIYQPSIRHAFSDGSNVVGAGPMPWDIGDQLLANIQAGLTAQQTRTAPPAPTAEQTRQALLSQVDAFRNDRLAAGFADTGSGGTGKTYACDDSSIGRWTAMAASAQPFAMGIAPGGLTAPTYQPIPTDNSIPSAMTAAAVYTLFEGRVMPWVAATVIYGRTMKNAILAGNAPADITQGWP